MPARRNNQTKYAVYIIVKLSKKRYFEKGKNYSKEKLREIINGMYENMLERTNTYVGVTNNFLGRRLRQHNGTIAGGAKYTRSGSWLPAIVICGLPTETAAKQLEWAIKNTSAGKLLQQKSKVRTIPIIRRACILFEVFSRERWTRKSPLNEDVLHQLHVWWHEKLVDHVSHIKDWNKLPASIKPAISVRSLHRCLAS